MIMLKPHGWNMYSTKVHGKWPEQHMRHFREWNIGNFFKAEECIERLLITVGDFQIFCSIMFVIDDVQ